MAHRTGRASRGADPGGVVEASERGGEQPSERAGTMSPITEADIGPATLGVVFKALRRRRQSWGQIAPENS